MENKYQESLDIVNERFDYMNEELHPNKHYLKPQFSLDTLQELIDLYTNESKYESFAEIHKEHQEEIAKLNKALDKACEKLEYVNNNVYFLDNNPMNYFNKEEWKQYLLKESEKQ